jgi:hypothetical protein
MMKIQKTLKVVILWLTKFFEIVIILIGIIQFSLAEDAKFFQPAANVKSAAQMMRKSIEERLQLLELPSSEEMSASITMGYIGSTGVDKIKAESVLTNSRLTKNAIRKQLVLMKSFVFALEKGLILEVDKNFNVPKSKLDPVTSKFNKFIKAAEERNFELTSSAFDDLTDLEKSK